MLFYEQMATPFITIRRRSQSSNLNFKIHEIRTRKTYFFNIEKKTKTKKNTQKLLQIDDETKKID